MIYFKTARAVLQLIALCLITLVCALIGVLLRIADTIEDWLFELGDELKKRLEEFQRDVDSITKGDKRD